MQLQSDGMTKFSLKKTFTLFTQDGIQQTSFMIADQRSAAESTCILREQRIYWKRAQSTEKSSSMAIARTPILCRDRGGVNLSECAGYEREVIF